MRVSEFFGFIRRHFDLIHYDSLVFQSLPQYSTVESIHTIQKFKSAAQEFLKLSPTNHSRHVVVKVLTILEHNTAAPVWLTKGPQIRIAVETQLVTP